MMETTDVTGFRQYRERHNGAYAGKTLQAVKVGIRSGYLLCAPVQLFPLGV